MKNNLLPADTYTCLNQSIITEIDKLNLINFYEPIIGPIAVSLYLTLINDESTFTHHHLMTILKSDIRTIVDARSALEAIGLIKSYVKCDDNINDYIYEIYAPLSASSFLNHPVLGVLLLNNIGQDEFKELLNKYKKISFKKDGYEEITKTMNDTFKITNSNILDVEIKENKVLDINLNQDYDYDLLISFLPKGLVNEKTFTKSIKDLIIKLSYVYDINISKMSELISMSLDDIGIISKEKLKDNAKKSYEFNNNGTLPTIVYRTQPDYLKKPTGDISPIGKMIQVFENTRPYDFLKAKNKSANPSKREVDILSTLAIEYDLTPGVINVLIDYTLRVNDGKLVKNYLESIASTWKRKGIKTVEEAMNDLKKNHKKNIKEKKVTTKKEIEAPSWINSNPEAIELDSEELKLLEEEMKGYR